jgi:hypothetical protein
MANRPIKDALRLGWRTSAYIWMWDHFDEIVVCRGAWLGLVERFAAEGVTRPNKRGEQMPFSTESIRKTYARVKADKAIAAQRSVPTPRPVPRQAAVAPTPIDTNEGDDAGFRFQLTKARP